MKEVVVIIEECHGAIGVASTFEKAKLFLLETGWVDESWFYYTHGDQVGAPIKEYFGENWQEKFLELSENDFDGSFYFEKQKYLE